jgi:hypothetical protein
MLPTLGRSQKLAFDFGFFSADGVLTLSPTRRLIFGVGSTFFRRPTHGLRLSLPFSGLHDTA